MSFNQFTAVRITDDQTSLEVSGDSDDLPKDTKSIQVALAHRPPGSDPVEIFESAKFDRAQPLTGGDLINGWTAVYELEEPGQYGLHDVLLVIASVVSGEGTDVWADTFPVIAMDDEKEIAPQP